VAVRRTHHGDLDAHVAQSSDAPCPVSFDRGSPFELEAELGEGGRGAEDLPLRAVSAAATAVRIPVGPVSVDGDVAVPDGATGVVLFAHGTGSSRHSPRNRYVAEVLQQARLATVLLDLLTPEEEALDEQTAELRFDIGLLGERLVLATDWLRDHKHTRELPIGCFGASTGAAAALIAAAERPQAVGAVVSRGGRPDLAEDVLERVEAPTLLIVGGLDTTVVELNEHALRRLRPAAKKLEIVPGATHLFPEPGALEQVAQLARDWFLEHVPAVSQNR
jgi:putative phosphoribosyl transferase